MGRAIQPFTLLNSVKVRAETLRFWPEQTAPVSAETRFSRTGYRTLKFAQGLAPNHTSSYLKGRKCIRFLLPRSLLSHSMAHHQGETMIIDRTLRSIVAVHASIPEDAFTAGALGTRREGSGVVIRDNGLVLTIGYLITEADEVWLTTNDGRVVPAHALAYDQETGFGLVQALGSLGVPALDFGDVAKAEIGDPVVIADGIGQFVRANIVAKQEFAGYWEYLLEEAIFVAPAHPSWGGAALIGTDGKLLGIGSLHLQMASLNEETADINMVVPINLLPPILDDLLNRGQVNKPPRPWLGAFSAESNGEVVVMSVAEGGPAAQAGLRRGDVISEIRDGEVDSLADFYRKVWESGPAGAEIPMRILRDGREAWLRVKSADRNSFLRKPQLQ
jgi:S1-C subfamily serine protease